MKSHTPESTEEKEYPFSWDSDRTWAARFWIGIAFIAAAAQPLSNLLN